MTPVEALLAEAEPIALYNESDYLRDLVARLCSALKEATEENAAHEALLRHASTIAMASRIAVQSTHQNTAAALRDLHHDIDDGLSPRAALAPLGAEAP